jgi:hypothetical protein
LLTVGFLEDVVGGFGPDEGLGTVVPAVDEVADPAGQVADAAEGAAMDGLAFDDWKTTPRRGSARMPRLGTSGPYTVVLHPAKAETGLQSWSNTKAQSSRHAWSVRCCSVAGRFT